VEEAASIKAAEQLGKLHDQLKAAGYQGHPLEVLLVRVLFCLFADDTGIFERRNQFKDYLEVRTAEDGVDLGQHLSLLFQVLNTPPEKRQKNLDELLGAFTYINGKLFEESLPIPAFDRAMRETLLDASGLDWSRISPAIFGSLFQSIMDKEARRNLGAHYTRESNILKALRPLFLDKLDAELATIGNSAKRLAEFQKKLASVRVLDPACGCGNFLVIAYRELRRLELVVLRRLLKAGESSKSLDIASLVYVDVDQFYGIEVEEFPAQIAQVALWLTDHQSNQRVSEEFGQYFARLPLKKAPNIVHGNALQTPWEDVVPAAKLSYIVGNPPFIGAKFQSDEQRADVEQVFKGTKNAGLLDYVCCWYRKATNYIQGTDVSAAFVSTNSITQGEQVGVLWPDLFARGAKIAFAHRTFQWSSEARGKAAVHCVIIGFGLREPAQRVIFDYEDIRGEPQAIPAKNINPYLVDAPDAVLNNRSLPICSVPEIGIGNKPIDGGWYLFTTAERDEFIACEPASAKWFRRWLGSDEFINGWERWCLWLGDSSPSELRQMPEAMKRVDAVRRFRLGIGPDRKGKTLKAGKERPQSTQKLANTPTRFHVEYMPQRAFLLIPKVSSERRFYLPIGFMTPDTFVSDLVFIVPDASKFHFGCLQSLMHNAWLRAVCGRLESRYR
jgi:type II restriction/modification system DNA methylase subunit YeeA